MRERRINILRNVMIMIISILFVLIASELAMRLFYGVPDRTMVFPTPRDSSYYQDDDELLWVPRKNIKGTHNKHRSFYTSFSTNSRGLRDREYAFEKSGNYRRIVVLGDSFTWGWGVNDKEIYTEKLEAILPKTDVINLGVTSYMLFQEIAYFKREGIKYNPDTIILGFYLDDIIWGPGRKIKTISSQHLNTSLNEENQSRRLRIKLYEKLKKYIFHNSALYSFIVDRIGTNRTFVKALVFAGVKELTGFEKLDINLKPALRNYPDQVSKCWDVTKTELLQLKQIAYDNGIRLIIVIIPSPHSIIEKRFEHAISHTIYYKEDFDLDKPYRLLEEFASSNNIELVNPVNIFRAENEKGISLYLNRDVHINAAGHKLLARVIADYLLNESVN